MALWNLFNFMRQGNNGNYINNGYGYQNHNNYMNNNGMQIPFNHPNHPNNMQNMNPNFNNQMPYQNHPMRQTQPPPRQQMPLQFQPPQQQANPANAPQNMGPVSFEPADEETMKEVQRLIKEKMKSEGKDFTEKEVLAPTKAVGNSNTPNKGDILGDFIQGEYNGAKFYRQLAKSGNSRQFSQELEEIASSCDKTKSQLDMLFAKKYSSQYGVKQSELVHTDNVRAALSKAVEIESKSLRGLIDYYDFVNDSYDAKIINSIIIRKICDIRIIDNLIRRG